MQATLYELSKQGRTGVALPECDVPEVDLPKGLMRDDNGLPELSELDVARHYLHLSQRNFSVESGFNPLGSCTMKYNPKIDEDMARLEGFVWSHPLQQLETAQGSLAVVHELQTWLAEIGGYAAVSLQPSAGAHSELTALLMVRAFLADRGDPDRRTVLIPDSAHGTNPASTTMAGLAALEIPSDERGNVDLAALEAACDSSVACLMITNPNTLGLYEQQLKDIVELIHGCGGLVYGDGANMNALTGIARPGDLGIDLMHYNLHKTFATPHGGGGPGSGPLAVSTQLAPFLPGPLVIAKPGREVGMPPTYGLAKPEKSIGRVSSFFGSFGMLVRAYAYIRLHGEAGLRANAMHAVLNANYLRARLRETFRVPFDRINMHEFVCEGRIDDSPVRAIDIAKRLLDYGIHPPTNYFPLTVREALMVEPTESESKETLDAFVDAMLRIAHEASEKPALVQNAPHTAPVRRVDEVKAARALKLTEFDR